VTNIKDLGRKVPGSHHVFILDTLHRRHAVVEDRLRTELATAEPESPRAMPLHIPARLTSHARNRVLKIKQSWPQAHTVVKAWGRLGRIPASAT
jgi:hypothetical protein